ncbi:exopolysaccharide biosynthesis WecB/TagA/CpsF family protein [Aminobacter ciceronei]|uniref:Exopolysaccharide biosynthesis WecB/TagA/CpsF family protein n=2 Tax=Aminobacter ciceronei TaxID=150723 RepID=A0ABR6CB17_9HYPH|nr:exopolysaccharide biosynthesis WecB/TagA/CpsF family protein [Aminobacter ciceronei]MBA9021642.1 exopolysaccharide biosynthesis WecB/TagA/CpsF family protein [Aminobacter ciceronei]
MSMTISEAAASYRSILGIRVASLRRDEAISLLTEKIRDRSFTKVSFLNAHNANIACSDKDFAAVLNGFLVLADGIGVDIAARWLYGAPFPDNLNGTDFVPDLLKASDKPLTVALLGAKRANAERAAARLGQIAPHHKIVVVHDGFFTSQEEPGIVAAIGSLRPDILLVAMGVPRQEMWIAQYMRPEHCTLPIAVGALLDFLSGSVPRAPAWVRRLRLEWLFRLLIEPGRLWRRYVVGNPLFLFRVLRQKIRGGGQS